MIDKNILSQIIEDLFEVCGELKLTVTGETLLREACSYHRGMLAQGNKNKESPMTDKQRGFIKQNQAKLRSMGFDIDNIQSKSDAFKIIKQFKEG